MSKTRETWAFQEVIASSKLNQANTDWITKGQLIHSSFASIYPDDLSAITFTGVGVGVGMYPYTPAKHVYDRMRVMAGTRAYGLGAAAIQVQYTINGGGAYINTPLATALPIGGFTTMQYAGMAAYTLDQSRNGYDDVDISGVPAATWFAFALTFAGCFAASYWLTVFLYSSVDTPF